MLGLEWDWEHSKGENAKSEKPQQVCQLLCRKKIWHTIIKQEKNCLTTEPTFESCRWSNGCDCNHAHWLISQSCTHGWIDASTSFGEWHGSWDFLFISLKRQISLKVFVFFSFQQRWTQNCTECLTHFIQCIITAWLLQRVQDPCNLHPCESNAAFESANFAPKTSFFPCHCICCISLLGADNHNQPCVLALPQKTFRRSQHSHLWKAIFDQFCKIFKCFVCWQWFLLMQSFEAPQEHNSFLPLTASSQWCFEVKSVVTKASMSSESSLAKCSKSVFPSKKSQQFSRRVSESVEQCFFPSSVEFPSSSKSPFFPSLKCLVMFGEVTLEAWMNDPHLWHL